MNRKADIPTLRRKLTEFYLISVIFDVSGEPSSLIEKEKDGLGSLTSNGLASRIAEITSEFTQVARLTTRDGMRVP